MKEHIQPSNEPQTFIRLVGEPYQRQVSVNGSREVIDCSQTFSNLVDSTHYPEYLARALRATEPYLDQLVSGAGYYELDEKIKHGRHLDFADAFCVGTFVCAALNRPLHSQLGPRIRNLGSPETHLMQATSLLSALSAKEAYVGLTPEEIAGLVAATISLDTVVHVRSSRSLMGFGGMGGDRGYPINGENTKLFSLSTLAAIATSLDGPVMKHHSYPNTSKVAGQSAIEAYGARSDFHSLSAFESVLSETNLIMTSCHDTRSLHTLSHKLKGETINHVIGPLAFTLAPDVTVNGIIGVNEKVHPEIVIKALGILHEKGFQRYGNSVSYFGTDSPIAIAGLLQPQTYQNSPELKRHVAIDEVAPPPYVTIASFRAQNRDAGTYTLFPEDFYPSSQLAEIRPDSLRIHNSREGILQANQLALSGQDVSKSRYLAMTIGLALFTKNYLNKQDALDPRGHRVNRQYLQACTQVAYANLVNGRAEERLSQYIDATQCYAGGN